MLKEIVVSEDEYETRVALLEDKALVEIYSEPKGERRILGNIYKGRVTSVLPGMQVAFVDIGLERNAFLHVSDVVGVSPPGRPPVVEPEDELEETPEAGAWGRPTIEEILEKGQEILVQVERESMGSKGPRVTAHPALPGRYLVFMPTLDTVGISRKVEDAKERQRLKALVERLRPSAFGFIIRTAAQGKGEEEFLAEMQLLVQYWERLLKEAEQKSAPALIHEDLGLIFRTIRDQLTDDVEALIIDSREAHRRVMEYLDQMLPALKGKVRLYKRKEPLFEHYGIESEIKRALRQKIWLKSGGHIVIDQTEAMVAIDINTGRYVGKANPDDTILKTNLEAIGEITRQIRLRDIGGIIVIDFIDMENRAHRQQVLDTLKEALKRDRARTHIVEFTELGLVEMTRQRMRPSLRSMLCQTCPYCSGSGTILSEETISTEILRTLRKVAPKIGKQGLKVIASEAIARRLSQVDQERVIALSEKLRMPIEIEADPDLHVEDYRILSLQSNQEISLY